jgi:hypothetical protein
MANIIPKKYALNAERNSKPVFSNVPLTVKTATKMPANMKISAMTKTMALLPLLFMFNLTLFYANHTS